MGKFTVYCFIIVPLIYLHTKHFYFRNSNLWHTVTTTLLDMLLGTRYLKTSRFLCCYERTLITNYCSIRNVYVLAVINIHTIKAMDGTRQGLTSCSNTKLI